VFIVTPCTYDVMQSLGFSASLVDSLTRKDSAHLEHHKVIIRSVLVVVVVVVCSSNVVVVAAVLL